MMQNYLLRIEYSGENYSGWQVQPNIATIQGEIVKALKIIFKTDINLIGSGRTDAGVHALGQAANFKIEKEFDLYKIRHSLNSILPDDISISTIEKVSEEFHSRFDATKRSYLYIFTKEKTPFFKNFAYNYSPVFNLDLTQLNEISNLLLGKHDFTSFSKKKTDTENMVCDISLAKWRRVKNKIIFRIDGNRFLHGMVRTIVGTVLEIAEKNKPTDEIIKIINAKNREVAGRSVPAKGLFLLDVKY